MPETQLMNEKASNIQGNTQTNRTKRVRTHQSMNYLKKEPKKKSNEINEHLIKNEM